MPPSSTVRGVCTSRETFHPRSAGPDRPPRWRRCHLVTARFQLYAVAVLTGHWALRHRAALDFLLIFFAIFTIPRHALLPIWSATGTSLTLMGVPAELPVPQPFTPRRREPHPYLRVQDRDMPREFRRKTGRPPGGPPRLRQSPGAPLEPLGDRCGHHHVFGIAVVSRSM